MSIQIKKKSAANPHFYSNQKHSGLSEDFEQQQSLPARKSSLGPALCQW
jgi:hypothetical protein